MWGRGFRVALVAAVGLAVGAPGSLGAPVISLSDGGMAFDARTVPGLGGTSALVDGAGRGPVLAAWIQRRGGTTTLWTSDMDFMESWHTPKAVLETSHHPTSISLLAVDVAQTGIQRVMYGESSGADEMRVRVVQRKGHGKWSRPATLGNAAVGGLLGARVEAQLATAGDGTATAIWCRGGQSDNALDTSQPGTIFTATADAAGRWSAPKAIWKAQFCSALALQVSPNGTALASWYDEPAEVGTAQQLTLLRTPQGVWGTTPQVVEQIGEVGTDARTSPILGRDGVARLLAGGSGREASDPGAQLATMPPASELPVVEDVPGPSTAQAADGWIGAGRVLSAALQLDKHGDPMVLTARGAANPHNGGATVGGLWASTRKADGTWSVEPVDAFAAASDPGGTNEPTVPTFTSDGEQSYVTWTQVASETPCVTETFHAMHDIYDEWRPLVLASVDRRGRGTCHLVPQAQTVERGDVVWSASTRRLRVVHVWDSDRTIKPRLRLRTRTFRAIRRAGAIEFGCQLPRRAFDDGVCRVSLIEAERDPAVFEALEGVCRPSVAAAPVRRGRTAVIRFPLAKDCYAGGRAPHPTRHAMRFRALAVADVLSAESDGVTANVRIRP